jgi:hypothetical protein
LNTHLPKILVETEPAILATFDGGRVSRRSRARGRAGPNTLFSFFIRKPAPYLDGGTRFRALSRRGRTKADIVLRKRS